MPNENKAIIQLNSPLGDSSLIINDVRVERIFPISSLSIAPINSSNMGEMATVKFSLEFVDGVEIETALDSLVIDNTPEELIGLRDWLNRVIEKKMQDRPCE